MMCVLILGLILVIELRVLYPDGAFVWLSLVDSQFLAKDDRDLNRASAYIGIGLAWRSIQDLTGS